MKKPCRVKDCRLDSEKEIGDMPVCRGHYDDVMIYGRGLIFKPKGQKHTGRREGLAA